MAKQPYIPFYVGDYIKDTRILPLNVRGGWVDLILAMWDHDPKGELIGTIEDFSRIMNCTVSEADLVIQTLKQKKIFAWADLIDGQMRIVSRKQKKMKNISEKRKIAGELGGNPILVKQRDMQKDNQDHKQNPEYEYDTENIKDVKEGAWNKMPGQEHITLILPDIKAGAAEQFMILSGTKVTRGQVLELWEIFKVQNLTGTKFYNSPNDVFSHFINWSKTQKINGTPQQGIGNGANKLGTSEARTETAKKW